MSGDILLLPLYAFMWCTVTTLSVPRRQVKIENEYVAAAEWPAVLHCTLQISDSKYGPVDCSFS
jgi:hypothetical protein